MAHSGGEVRIISTTAMKAALDALAPAFERETGCTLAFQYGPSGRMAGLVAGGTACDVAIVTAGGIDELTHAGRLVAGSRCDVARSVIGVAVQKGARRPDISSVAAFRDALRAARAIAMSNPTGGAQSGAHLAKVFTELGIADELKAKSIYGPGGPAGLVGNYLLRGEAEIGLQQMPELMAVPGIDIVGPLPDELQLTTVFSAGLSSTSTNPTGARAWITHLSGAAAAVALNAAGLAPCR